MRRTTGVTRIQTPDAGETSRAAAEIRLATRNPANNEVCEMSHVFGPVPSRRLGRSLGVDLVPFKTCTYDCIYCQLGRTTNKTIERKEWVPLEEVLAELKDKLCCRPDYITLSGSGEPTLYSRMDELIGRIRSMTDTPVAVLTNGSLLWQEEVCAQMMAADLVIPSLDAGSTVMFATVNRPHQDITLEKLLNGLVEFRQRFTGRFWLEVFLLAGYTADASEVRHIAKYVDLIRPERVQLNTVARPPAEAFAMPVAQERLLEYASMFTPQAEIIADFRKTHDLAEFEATRKEVIDLLRRRPCSVDDLANGLSIHRNEVAKYVEELRARGLVEWTRTGRTLFYRASR